MLITCFIILPYFFLQVCLICAMKIGFVNSEMEYSNFIVLMNKKKKQTIYDSVNCLFYKKKRTSCFMTTSLIVFSFISFIQYRLMFQASFYLE
jgi:hypothetical protein